MNYIYNQNKWDKRFMQMAELVASWSKDPSTKCGAVITKPNHRIVSVGFNGFPKGIKDDIELYENRDIKYKRVIHSEKNAILFSKGQDLAGCIMYVVPMPPCSQCTAFIIQSGIARIVTIAPNKEQMIRWGNDFRVSLEMFKEAKVDLVYA